MPQVPVIKGNVLKNEFIKQKDIDAAELLDINSDFQL